MDVNYKKQWGSLAQTASLANTGEPLYVVVWPGSRPSHEQAAEHLDRRAAAGVKFVLGMPAMWNLYEHAENLPRNALQ